MGAPGLRTLPNVGGTAHLEDMTLITADGSRRIHTVNELVQAEVTAHRA
jgi:hypothetical protein